MPQNRKHPRYLTLMTGRIALDGRWIDCAVLNISASGACLLVQDAAEIPDSFDLTVDRINLRISCRLIWRDAHRVGVAYVEVRPLSQPGRPALDAPAAADLQGQTA